VLVIPACPTPLPRFARREQPPSRRALCLQIPVQTTLPTTSSNARSKFTRRSDRGLLESAYAACLAFELTECGHLVEARKPVPLVYKGIALSVSYYLDMLVDGEVVVELKSVDAVAPIHEAQLLTYLRLTGSKVGLLINFNVPVVKDGVHRIVSPVI